MLKFCTRFLINNDCNTVFGIFILFKTWVIYKNVKYKYVETKSFRFLQITQDVNKIEIIPNTLL